MEGTHAPSKCSNLLNWCNSRSRHLALQVPPLRVQLFFSLLQTPFRSSKPPLGSLSNSTQLACRASERASATLMSCDRAPTGVRV